jgi:hypothetical protein
MSDRRRRMVSHLQLLRLDRTRRTSGEELGRRYATQGLCEWLALFAQ